MLDEIYTAKRIEYSSASGKVMGLTQAGEVASTILCFMASSVCDKYQDVVALIPISHLKARKQHGMLCHFVTTITLQTVHSSKMFCVVVFLVPWSITLLQRSRYFYCLTLCTI